MAKLYNLARMTTTTTGTGTITLGSAVAGYLTFAQAGVANGDVVDYAIKDGNDSEIGTGTYTSSGTTLTRTVTKSTNSNAAINLSGAAEVFITPRAETLTLGTAAYKDTGTTAGNVVEVQTGGKLPALDGSNLSNLPQKVVQTVYAEYTAQATLTANIPGDNTIPQSTEGTQILSASITPTSASNRVRASVFLAGQVAEAIPPAIGALFRGGANAIAAKIASGNSGGVATFLDFIYEDSPGTTSTLTYTVRVGASSGISVKMNQLLGGSQRCVLILEEIKP